MLSAVAAAATADCWPLALRRQLVRTSVQAAALAGHSLASLPLTSTDCVTATLAGIQFSGRIARVHFRAAFGGGGEIDENYAVHCQHLFKWETVVITWERERVTSEVNHNGSHRDTASPLH